jgi:hypothetical protein
MNILELKHFQGLNYKKEKLNTAEIKHVYYKSGYYPMENILDYEYYDLDKRTKITILKVNGQEVMVDDPLHWYGMKNLSEMCFGKVCVAGLGLGIIAKFLSENHNVTEVVIYEINEDVIKLVSKYLNLEKITIKNEDFFDVRFKPGDYDVIIVDLFKKEMKDSEMTVCGFNYKVSTFSIMSFYLRLKYSSDSKIFFWGFRDPELVKPNPKGSQLNDTV